MVALERSIPSGSLPTVFATFLMKDAIACVRIACGGGFIVEVIGSGSLNVSGRDKGGREFIDDLLDQGWRSTPATQL